MSPSPLSGLSEAARTQALERFELLRPFLENGIALRRVAREQELALRTARRWVALYRREGLAGLARKPRSDRGERHLSARLRQAIEGLALENPRRSVAAIHRQATIFAEHLGEPTPCYVSVYTLVRGLE